MGNEWPERVTPPPLFFAVFEFFRLKNTSLSLMTVLNSRSCQLETKTKMGCHHSKSNSMNGRPMGLSAPCDGQDRASSKEAEARSKQIGRQLKRDYYASKDIVKLLLLGKSDMYHLFSNLGILQLTTNG